MSDAVPAKFQQDLLTRLDTTSSLIQATFYYRFYLFRALKKVGLADQYVSMLKPWQDMLGMGLTTFAENPEPSRSDCHAWSASPVFDFLATICGVEPAEAGFRSVKIEPHLGYLNRVEGKIPHPLGNISIMLERENKGINGKIVLPEGLSGRFFWNKQTLILHSGQNLIDL